MNKKLLILLTFCIITIVKSDEFCRVLVLEGGGDRGAYHAGAFQQFVDQLSPEDVQYDIVSGISAGGLNAGAISFFEKGDEKSARDYLKNIWSTIRRENVWQTWSIFDDPLFNKQGLLDTSPLRAYLTNLVSQNEFKRNFTIGTTDLNTGNILRLKFEDVPTKEDQVNMMMSTSAIPIVFPHISWRNTTFVDGGLDKMMDITGGVQWCKQNGYSENQIIVDAILCFGTELNQQKDHSQDNTLQVLFRSLDVLTYNLLQSEIIQAKDNYPDVNFRYLVIPPIFFDNDIFLLFTPSVVQAMYNSGIHDAQEVINKGFGKSWDELTNKFKGTKNPETQQLIEQSKMKIKLLKEMFLQK